jgi:hypothetical protein
MRISSATFFWGSLLLALPACAEDSPALPLTIAPDNPGIRYIGRFEMKDPKKPRFSWAGSSFAFCFQGKALNLLMQDECGGGPNKLGGNTNNYFSVVIDDKEPLELSLEKGRTVYRVAEGLADGAHTVTVFRRNCPRIDPCQFLGLQLEEGKSLAAPPPPKKRCIEVVGDSISVGYGIMGKEKTSPAIPMNENCYLTYGALSARELDADFVCIAWSGMGVYRDLKGKLGLTMPILYDRTVPNDKDSVWSFKGYTPDVVVINLGTNDFTPGVPDKAEFNKAYRAFVEKIWSHAPKAHVFCVVGGMVGDPTAEKEKEFLAEMIAELTKDGKTSVHIVKFPQIGSIPEGLGGQWHPSIKAHRAFADVLIPAIKKELGW